MAKSKTKTGQTRAPATAPCDHSVIPVAEPLPDFDNSALDETCAQLADAGAALSRRLNAILALAQETTKSGALQALASSKTSCQLTCVLDELDDSLRRSTQLLNSFRRQYGDWQDAERRTRRFRFERLATSRGWNVVGSWPEPVVRGIVFVSVDEPKDKALINGRPLASPTAERLIQAVAIELDQLQKGLTAPAEFATQALTAYKACGAAPGDGVGVHDLLARMTWQRQSKQFQRDPREESFRGYPVSQFRADLTSYLAAGAAPVSDSKSQFDLEIAGGSFAQDGLFMYFPQSDRLATCGRVTFRRSFPGEEP